MHNSYCHCFIVLLLHGYVYYVYVCILRCACIHGVDEAYV